jgi:hypothetical protein
VFSLPFCALLFLEGGRHETGSADRPGPPWEMDRYRLRGDSNTFEHLRISFGRNRSALEAASASPASSFGVPSA